MMRFRLLIVLMIVAGATPTSASQLRPDAIQHFQGGLMIWDSQTGGIWVLNDWAQTEYFPQSRYESLPDNPVPDHPPTGYVKPVSGFGRVWGNFEHIRSQLGWAVEEEYNFSVNIRPGPNSGGGLSQQLANLPSGRIAVLRGDNSWGYLGVPRLVAELPDQTAFPATFQEFAGGYMVWWSETGSVWVLYHNSATRHFTSQEYGGLSANPVLESPPPGRFKPINGFGKVWGHFPEIREWMGWALTPEEGYHLQFERRITQWTSFGPRTAMFITTPDGGRIRLAANGGWWWE